MLLSFGLALVLTVSAFMVQVPYVLLSGGPVYNTTGEVDGVDVIQITGRTTYPTNGQLDLTTVRVDRTISLAEAIAGWFDRDQAVAPSELLYPPDKSEKQIQAEAARQMVRSQNSAKTAALLKLGLPVQVTVSAVGEDAPAAGNLAIGDVLTEVAGKPVTSPDRLRELVTARPPGAPVTVSFVRDGRAGTVTFDTGSAGKNPARAVLGIGVAVTDYPFDIDIALENVGGPSAGLMFALGIIDELTPGSLTDGRRIAGTGTIDEDGDVGPIGGIQQKLSAAGELDVEVFLVPTRNCEAAAENRPEDLQLIRVTSLSSALAALEVLRQGGIPPSCSS